MILDFVIVLLICQLVGEVIAVATELPIPGPVIGMALLFAGLCIRRGVPDGLGRVSGTLLDHLSLLFVPAGVGVLVHLPLLESEFPAIAAALVGSTLIAIVVTARVVTGIRRWTSADERR